MTQTEKAIAEARTWLGTPYHHAARIKGVGCDCGNLLCAVYEAAGAIPPTDPRPYAEDWNLHRGEEFFIGWLTRLGGKQIDGPRPGCIALWKYGRTFSHGGVMVDSVTMIHAFKTSGAVVSSRVDQEPMAGREVQWWTLIHGEE